MKKKVIVTLCNWATGEEPLGEACAGMELCGVVWQCVWCVGLADAKV